MTMEKIIFKGTALSVVLPCAFGYLGVLHGHAPLVAQTASGQIRIKTPSGEFLTFASQQNGLLKVGRDGMSVLL